MNTTDTVNIFLVEDDQFMVRIYEKSFKFAGFNIVGAATDGESAIADLLSMTEKPDIVVLDIMIPKLNGFEVLEIMKKDKDLKDVPVVILTNLYSQDDEKKGLMLGALYYMVKSQYSSMEIVGKIKDIYEKHHKNK